MLLVCSPAWAVFNLLLHNFTGDEPTMAPGPQTQTGYCDQYGGPDVVPAALPYQVLGTAQAGRSGIYRAVDVGVDWFGVPGSGDGVLLIYEASFDPANPTDNLVGAFNRSYENFVNDEQWVELVKGTDYVMVVQLACIFQTGIAGLSLTGPGKILGAGFQAADYASGSYASAQSIADFPEWGIHKYAEPYAYTAPRTGNYWFLDAGRFWDDAGSVTGQRVYSQPFDPDNPEANLLTQADFFFFGLFLEAGQVVYIVNVDLADTDDIYQTIIYPPGDLLGINPDITGTFYNPAMPGQGILMEADSKLNLMFIAVFTFDDAPVPTLQQSVGSEDQRWLSATGAYDPASTSVPLTFQNATGGTFNQIKPAAKIDEAYGSGMLTALDCYTAEITYSLPGVAEGKFELVRLLPFKGKSCTAYLPIAEPLR
jgi:hypothetical protein